VLKFALWILEGIGIVKIYSESNPQWRTAPNNGHTWIAITPPQVVR